MRFTGFEQVMDEPRVSPHFVPNTGKNITILYGEPINSRILPLLSEYREKFPQGWRPNSYEGSVAEDLELEPEGLGDLRSRIACELREGLMGLGKRVGEVEKQEPGKIVGW